MKLTSITFTSPVRHPHTGWEGLTFKTSGLHPVTIEADGPSVTLTGAHGSVTHVHGIGYQGTNGLCRTGVNAPKAPAMDELDEPLTSVEKLRTVPPPPKAPEPEPDTDMGIKRKAGRPRKDAQ